MDLGLNDHLCKCHIERCMLRNEWLSKSPVESEIMQHVKDASAGGLELQAGETTEFLFRQFLI